MATFNFTTPYKLTRGTEAHFFLQKKDLYEILTSIKSKKTISLENPALSFPLSKQLFICELLISFSLITLKNVNCDHKDSWG